jgi:light-regulated signal transduction histidine kinase (bacteriophytochrome)
MKLNENLSFLIKHTPAAVAMFDTNVCYLAHSDRWLTDYQLGNVDIIGKSHYEVFPDILERWKRDHQRVLRGEVLKKDEEQWVREDNKIMYLRYELRPWYNKNEEIGGLIMFTEVITPIVEARKKLERSVAELQQSNKDLKEFAYIASHDLMEPVRNIHGLVQLLEGRIENQISSDDFSHLATIKKASHTMIDITDGLLEFSRIGRVEEKKENINVSKLFAKLQEKYQNETVQIDIPNEEYSLVFTKKWFIFIVESLLLNAIKFNLSDQKQVRIGVTQASKATIVTVEDNGIGLDADDDEKVFAMFQRLHNQKDFIGKGVSLALCKKIIEHNGGKMWYEPNANKGTTFFFSIFDL